MYWTRCRYITLLARRRVLPSGELRCAAVECYRRRQTTTTDASEQNNTGCPTLCVGASNNRDPRKQSAEGTNDAIKVMYVVRCTCLWTATYFRLHAQRSFVKPNTHPQVMSRTIFEATSDSSSDVTDSGAQAYFVSPPAALQCRRLTFCLRFFRFLKIAPLIRQRMDESQRGLLHWHRRRESHYSYNFSELLFSNRWDLDVHLHA